MNIDLRLLCFYAYLHRLKSMFIATGLMDTDGNNLVHLAAHAAQDKPSDWR